MINSRWLGLGVLMLVISGCGDNNGSASTVASGASPDPIANAAPNVASAVVEAGPANSLNTLMTSVQICAPGTSNCQTVNNIEIDTGSSGLRILSAALSPSLTLPVENDGNGNSLLECVQFVDGFSWGPVAVVDMTISGETATSLPIQIIGDSNFPAVPAACSSTGPSEDTVDTFGANGILGVGPFAQDCGPTCVSSTAPGFYYLCSSTQCSQSIVDLKHQVQNPVTLFATDNNGVIIQLPSIPAAGASSVTGAVVFGVDTESNNASGSAKVLTMDSQGNLTTVFNGQTLTDSFFDSGSNSLDFTDSALPECSAADLGFYCPQGTQNLSATAKGLNGASSNISFTVANADSLGAGNSSLVAFANLAGNNPDPDSFDWGLPFFYGRNVYTVFEGYSSSAGAGPYVAF